MSNAPTTSHGRGGIGNHGPDTTNYVDGEIFRAGPRGDQGDGRFSTGHGGNANTGAKGSPVFAAADRDVIPPEAKKVEKMESHHYGRGGAGNGKFWMEKRPNKGDVGADGNYAETYMPPHKHQDRAENAGEEGLADKLKEKIIGHNA